MDVKKCTFCNIEKENDHYKKDRNKCNKWYNMNRKIYNSNTFFRKDNDKNKKKFVDTVKYNRTFIIGFSNCGITYLMNQFLLLKQEPIFIIRKSIKHYPNIEAQTTDGMQSLNEYENSTVVFDDMLLSKQESDNDLFFNRGRHSNIDIYYISQSYFLLARNTIRNNYNINILVKQTLRDIILIFHDKAGLDMNLEEWKQLCRKAWENDYDYLQTNRFPKIRDGSYTIRICNKTTYMECTPQTKRL